MKRVELDLNYVKSIVKIEIVWFHVAIGSGGMYCGGIYFLKNGAEPNKDRVLSRLQD